MTKSTEEIKAKIEVLMSKIHEDLQLSVPSKLFDNISLPKMAAGLMGFPTVEFPGLTSMINESIEQNKLVEEIAAITRKTVEEVIEIYQSHPYSLQTIKSMAMMGNKLNERNKDMEELISYNYKLDNVNFGEIILPTIEQQTFIIILPNNDRREVKASYMEVDGATLLFEDDNQRTILVYAPGSWLWAERQDENPK